MSWVKDKDRQVDVVDFNDLFEMMKDSAVFGAFQLQFQHLLLDKIMVFDGDTPLSDFGINVVKSEWSHFIMCMAMFYKTHGLCPYIIIEKDVPVLDRDSVREKKYGEFYDTEQETVKVRVPSIPVRGTYQIWQRLNGKETELFAVDQEGEICKDIHFALSTLCQLPDWFTGRFYSECAVLLDEWRRLTRARRLQAQVEFSNALPPIVIERQNRTDLQMFTELQAAQLVNLQGIRVTPNGFVETTEVSTNVVAETTSFDLLHDQLIGEGRLVDRSLLTHQVPDGFHVAQHVPEARMLTNVTELQQHFEQSVALVMRIPLSYIQGDGASRALINNQSGSDPERARLINHVSLIRNDITIGLKKVWLTIYGEEDRNVRFHIPIPTIVDIPSLLELYEYGAIPDPIAMEELLNVLNIEPGRVEEHLNLKTHKLKRFRPTVDDVNQQKQQKGKTASKKKKPAPKKRSSGRE